MKIEGNTVIFESIKENFDKERSGNKPNTVRNVLGDEKVMWDKFVDEWKHGYPKKVRIEFYYRSDREPVSFTRRITDLTFYTPVYIISWNPNELIY